MIKIETSILEVINQIIYQNNMFKVAIILYGQSYIQTCLSECPTWVHFVMNLYENY